MRLVRSSTAGNEQAWLLVSASAGRKAVLDTFKLEICDEIFCFLWGVCAFEVWQVHWWWIHRKDDDDDDEEAKRNAPPHRVTWTRWPAARAPSDLPNADRRKPLKETPPGLFHGLRWFDNASSSSKHIHNMGNDIFLVVGGSGFLGRHIVQQLLDRKDIVSALDIVQRYHDVPFYSADITDQSQVESAIQKVCTMSFEVLQY